MVPVDVGANPLEPLGGDALWLASRGFLQGVTGENVITLGFVTLAWLALALIPARIAARKSRSAVGFYFFGLLFFVPALVTALLISDKPGSFAAIRADRYVKALSPTEAEPPTFADAPPGPLRELEKLHVFMQYGILSEGEFEQAKQRTLGQL